MNRHFSKITINFKRSRVGQFCIPGFVFAYFLIGCSASPEKQSVNDFSTQARVEYVLECMNQKGGQSYQTLYPCVCSADKVAALMTPEEYAEALTFDRLGNVRGERGAIFRDPPRAKELRRRLTEAKSAAARECGQNL